MLFLVDCIWSDWSNWGECDKTCERGTQMRVRTSPDPLFGGENCTGDSQETRDCNTFDCAGTYTFTIIIPFSEDACV